MTTQYQKIPVPGYVNPTSDYTDPEILYSTVGFTQKGVTVGSGQGALAAGTVLAMKTADKKYYVYNNAGAGGVEVARGVLRRPIDTTNTVSAANDQVSNIVIAGILKWGLIVGADAAALTDLGATVDTVRGTMKL